MDYKALKIDTTTTTKDLKALEDKTGNIFESIVIMSRRANQITLDLKDDLSRDLTEVISFVDNLEEVFENKEQIELVKLYERLPKPSLIATHEFLNDKIYSKNPFKEEQNSNK